MMNRVLRSVVFATITLVAGVLIGNSALRAHEPAQVRSVTPPAGRGPTSTAVGPMYALVIGIDHYDDPSFPALMTARKDAQAVSAILQEQYGFETKVLLDATRRDIITALDAYRGAVPETASLLIYYGGHGTYDKDADKASWLPRDAERAFTANWIKADDITSEIRAIPARHILVISDSCYSGGLTRDADTSVGEGDHARYVQRLYQAKSRHLLSSGANEPVSDGGGGQDHSIFAAALLKGLGAMRQSAFTGSELFHDFISVSVAGRSQQSPQYVPLQNSGHDSGDFVFVRKGGVLPTPDPASQPREMPGPSTPPPPTSPIPGVSPTTLKLLVTAAPAGFRQMRSPNGEKNGDTTFYPVTARLQGLSDCDVLVDQDGSDMICKLYSSTSETEARAAYTRASDDLSRTAQELGTSAREQETHSFSTNAPNGLVNTFRLSNGVSASVRLEESGSSQSTTYRVTLSVRSSAR